MTYRIINGLKVWGQHDENTLQQMNALTQHPDVVDAALMADGHKGFSQPIGGVVAYRENLSVSGAGADLACGNKAVRTNLTYGDVKHDLSRIADEVAAQVAFGIGRHTVKADKADHALFDDSAWSVFDEVTTQETSEKIKQDARGQLGTVGSSNHYVDIFVETHEEHVSHGMGDTSGYPVYDDYSPIWIGVHFGSRGLGFKINAGFTNMHYGLGFSDKVPRGSRDEEAAVLVERSSDLGALYLEAMNLAGDYAYAGRDYVVQQVLDILGAEETKSAHNHHNFIWREKHGGEDLWVVRKGSTPLHPGQASFIGGSMCDEALIVQGKDFRGTADIGDMRGLMSSAEAVAEQQAALYSTVHGAGRVMGRMQAKGKECKRCVKRGTRCQPGTLVSQNGTQPCDGSGWTRPQGVKPEAFNRIVKDYGIHLRGGDLDESPFVYRRLNDVISNHANTLDILHRLRPIIVCMAGADVRDPFKD